MMGSAGDGTDEGKMDVFVPKKWGSFFGKKGWEHFKMAMDRVDGSFFFD